MHRTLLLTAAAMILAAAGCKNSKRADTPKTEALKTEAPETKTPKSDSPAGDIAGTVVELKTSAGVITIELEREKAPKSVQNFLRYVKDKHYDGTIFHRVIANFMIQGGGFDKDLKKKPTRAPVHNEADNGLKNLAGTVAMARTPNPHSASAQFFINVKDNDFLNHRDKTMRGWGYTVFGKVIKGMDVVNKIKAVPTGAKGPFSKDVPLTDVVIESARIVR